MSKKSKIPAVFLSWRFWVVFFIVLVESVQREGYLEAGVARIIVDALEYLGAGVAGIRTVDRFAEKMGSR